MWFLRCFVKDMDSILKCMPPKNISSIHAFRKYDLIQCLQDDIRVSEDDFFFLENGSDIILFVPFFLGHWMSCCWPYHPSLHLCGQLWSSGCVMDMCSLLCWHAICCSSRLSVKISKWVQSRGQRCPGYATYQRVTWMVNCMQTEAWRNSVHVRCSLWRWLCQQKCPAVFVLIFVPSLLVNYCR